MSKRAKFVLIALVLAAGLFFTQLVGLDYRYWAILGLSVLTYGLSAWGLIDDLKGVEWLTLLVLPIYYAISVALFYYLLPERLVTRVGILILFTIGMYALLLTKNIFSVAAIRTIQLLRAAHVVAFLITLVTSFFLFDTVFSFRLMPWYNALLAWVISFPLALVNLWSVNLEEKITVRVKIYSLCLAWMMTSLAFFTSFWALSVTGASLLLVTGMYVGLGLFQSHLTGRLFAKTLKEYLWVGGVVLLITFLTAQWG